MAEGLLESETNKDLPTHALVHFLVDQTVCAVPINRIIQPTVPELTEGCICRIKWHGKKEYNATLLCTGDAASVEKAEVEWVLEHEEEENSDIEEEEKSSDGCREPPPTHALLHFEMDQTVCMLHVKRIISPPLHQLKDGLCCKVRWSGRKQYDATVLGLGDADSVAKMKTEWVASHQKAGSSDHPAEDEEEREATSRAKAEENSGEKEAR